MLAGANAPGGHLGWGEAGSHSGLEVEVCFACGKGPDLGELEYV